MLMCPGALRRALIPLLSLAIVVAGLVLWSGAAHADRHTSKDRSDLNLIPTVADRGEGLPGMPQRCIGVPGKCELGRQYKGAPTLVLWGDSHAWQLIPAVRAAIGHQRINLVAFLFGGCPPLHPGLSTPEEVRAATSCRLSNHKALQFVINQTAKHRDIRVVLAGGWELYRYALDPDNPGVWQEHTAPSIAGAAKLMVHGTPRLFRTLGKKGVPADVVGQMPTVPVNAPDCPRREPYSCSLPRSAALPAARYIRRFVQDQHEQLRAPARLIDPTRYFCSPARCTGMVDGQSAYYDDTHISLYLSRRLAPYFESTVKRLLAA
jgi:hypothetical protein